MSDLTTNGTALFTSRINSNRVVVNGRETPPAPDNLMEDRIAVSPSGVVAIVAKGGTTNIAYGIVNFERWVELGKAFGAPSQCVAWIGDQFVFARIGQGGANLIEQRPDGSVIWSRPTNTSAGILYWDELDRRFIQTDERINAGKGIKVGSWSLLKAVRRGDWYCGQAINPDRLMIVHKTGSPAWNATKQYETPTFVVIGKRLICNGPTEFVPPYPAAPPPPSPPLPLPPPEPNPVPEIANRKDLVVKARDIYANLRGDERGYRICAWVAWELRDLGAGLLLDNGDTKWPHGPDTVSTDVIAFKHPDAPGGKVLTFDILKNAENTAEPIWSPTTPSGTGDLSKWRAPIRPIEAAPTPTPIPAPVPLPQPPPPCKFTPCECKCAFSDAAIAPILEKLAQLETLIRAERKLRAKGPFGTNLNGTLDPL